MDENEIQELKYRLVCDYEKLVGTVAGLTGSKEIDAREALHQAVCRMLAGLKRRPPGNPVVTWRPYIIQAAVNELRMEARRKKSTVLFGDLDPDKRRELLRQEAPGPTPAKQAEENELKAQAWKALHELPERERQVLRRRFLGQSYDEIARAFSVKRSTVEAYGSRGMETLRIRFGVIPWHDRKKGDPQDEDPQTLAG